MTGRDSDALAADLRERLLDVDPARFHVVCLPDFFLDHFVELPRWADALAAIERVHAQGGGNVQNLPQHLASGGNAANTALALARLGVKSHLVTRTNGFGKRTLQASLGEAGVDVSRVQSDGRLAITTALEFGPEKRNVMLSDPGSVRDYSPDDLDENDFTLIEGSDAVLIANWAQCVNGGTALIRAVTERANRHNTLVYVDTGDPSGRAKDVPAFVDDVLRATAIDVFAVNENELRHYANAPDARDRDAYEEAGTRLARELKGTLDLHTSAFTATWPAGADAPTLVPTRKLTARRATGAGDAWNAGNLLGHLMRLDADARLLLANATAAYYIESETGRHGSLRELAEYVPRLVERAPNA